MVAEPRVSAPLRSGRAASISVLLLCSHALFAFAQYASALEDCRLFLSCLHGACDATNQLLLTVDANVHVGFEAWIDRHALGYVEQQQCNTVAQKSILLSAS